MLLRYFVSLLFISCILLLSLSVLEYHVLAPQPFKFIEFILLKQFTRLAARNENVKYCSNK